MLSCRKPHKAMIIPNANALCLVGISGEHKRNNLWGVIKDDPVVQGNVRGTVTYAKAGANSRTTQIFMNFGNNKRLDKQGFAAFAKIRDGSLQGMQGSQAITSLLGIQECMAARGSSLLCWTGKSQPINASYKAIPLGRMENCSKTAGLGLVGTEPHTGGDCRPAHPSLRGTDPRSGSKAD